MFNFVEPRKVQVLTVNTEAAMLALAAETGDIAIRIDLNKTFILQGNNPAILSDWQELLSPTDTVQSVNGQTGNVNIVNISGNSATATNLQTSRNISSNGDVIWEVGFDGSEDVEGVAAIASENAVSNSKLANMPERSIKGRASAGVGDPEDLNAEQARATLELGTMAVQNASAVNISGGNIEGINALAIADGGTGASDEAGARANLKAVGSDASTVVGATEIKGIMALDSATYEAIATNPSILYIITDAPTLTLEVNTIISAFCASLVGSENASTARSTLGLNKAVVSDADGVAGASEIGGILAINQADFDLIAKIPDKLYFVPDAPKASGVFTSGDGKTVTVNDGIITSIV